MILTKILALLSAEEGHTAPLPGLLLGGAGAIVLAVGSAIDTGWVAIIGGVGLAVGMVAASVLAHMGVEYDIYERLNELEKK